MQKKVIMIIIGYILLMCIVGGGLFIKRQLDSIPVFDDALIQELLDSSEIVKTEPKETPETSDPNQGTELKSIDTEDTESDYWKNYYQETETGQVKKNPVVSQIQEKITTGDKLRIMKIVKKSLTSDDINSILSLSKDGFTSNEQAEIKSLLQEKVRKEDKQELKELLLKYL